MRDGRWLEKVNTICSTISALAALLALIIVLYPQIKPSNTNHIELANAGNVDSQMFLADHYYAVGDISQSIYWYSVASQTKGAHRATTINNLAYIYLTYDQFSRTKSDYYGNIARLFYTAAKGEKIKAAENLYIWLVSNPKELFGNQYEEFMEYAETTLKNDKDAWDEVQQYTSKWIPLEVQTGNTVPSNNKEYRYEIIDIEYILESNYLCPLYTYRVYQRMEPAAEPIYSYIPIDE